MIDKIIHTMFYGSFRAKLFVWSVFILFLVTVLLGVLAAVMGSTVFGVGAITCGAATLVTSQSMTLQDLERKDRQGKKRPRDRKKEKRRDGEGGSDHKDRGEREAIDNGAPMGSKEHERAKARYLASMNARKMKQLLKEHKIRQNHIFVMIDLYPQERISQTPAVMWRTDADLHILAIDAHAREFEIPLQDIKGIYYQKDIEADPETDYAPFQYTNFISKLYKPFLPEYREVSQDGKLVHVKNLFLIQPGISFTNTSMKGILQIVKNVPLLVDDALNTSQYVDEYFKEVYRDSILCKNGIYTLEEYRDKAEKVLDALLVAPMDRDDFSRSLRNMKRCHLITQDQMMKYMQIYVSDNVAGK